MGIFKTILAVARDNPLYVYAACFLVIALFLVLAAVVSGM
jgi:hypothetical protein